MRRLASLPALVLLAACGTEPTVPPMEDVAGVRPSFNVVGDPGVDIEKATNGFDADVAPGPDLIPGDPVTWTYVVTNTGTTDLRDVTMVDDKLGTICIASFMGPGDVVTCTAGGLVTAGDGQYTNVGTVTATSPDGVVVSDSDRSHYRAIVECTAEIGDFVWNDAGGTKGIQDPGEVGLAGVTVWLKDAAGNIIATTVTDANGFYLFTGLCAGDYRVDVVESTVPPGWMQTPTLIGSDRTIDNNVQDAIITLPANNSSDLTIDFGFMEPSAFEGCSPGYYKNLRKHGSAWAQAGYIPKQSVASVFFEAANAPFVHLGSATLHEGLSFRGGNAIDEAAEILLRAAIAAVLNADNLAVNYPFTSIQIITAVNAALVAGNRDFIVTLAFILDRENNAGCPL